ncbi:MAG: hypothetical protein WBM87_03875 [Woeseiaceae bacterium]
MTAGQRKPRKGIIAAASSILLFALCFAGTVTAAPNSTTAETNGLSTDDLTADALLTPTAKAAMHAAFEKQPPSTDGDTLPAAQTVVKQAAQEERRLPEVSARIPGISDNGLARFKRQMYRRDI